MFAPEKAQQLLSLDVPTLGFVSVCIAALLGLLLIFAWLQQRSARSLAWWGSAYLIGASSIALWGAPAPLFDLPKDWLEALTFLACGMIWNAVRLFHGRRILPVAAFAGAIVWLALCQLPWLPQGNHARMALGAIVVATYTFFIAFELRRERRKSLYSRTAAIVVPSVHATIFLLPLGIEAFMPASIGDGWVSAFALETMLYAVGTAFLMLLMVKENDVTIYRNAASTDGLTGLLNRRAFLEQAAKLCALRSARGEAVTILMLDLDHFKSINDRFGHAVGDDALRLFATVARACLRASDIIGRLGGEEFVVILAEPMDIATAIAERLRSAFEAAGVAIGGHAVGATVSIGAATSYQPATDVSALLSRTDAALYRAKHAGRNRVCGADDERPPLPGGRLVAACGGDAASEPALLKVSSSR